jgi:hypothetical protein
LSCLSNFIIYLFIYCIFLLLRPNLIITQGLKKSETPLDKINAWFANQYTTWFACLYMCWKPTSHSYISRRLMQETIEAQRWFCVQPFSIKSIATVESDSKQTLRYLFFVVAWRADSIPHSSAISAEQLIKNWD